MAIIGIDLGTTNSAVAIYRNGRAEIIENTNGARTTPSIVATKPNGELVFGENAKDALLSTPDMVVMEVKRLMGTDERVKLGDKEYRPEEISALVLRELRKYAEEKLGEPVTEAVITVPAYFSDSQRKATQKAGELAGLKVDRILNEPTAAAISYGLDNMDKEQHVLIYDLGGGTFDVSVVEIFEGVLEVKASAGNNHLGGMDFDNAIMDWIVAKVKEEHDYDLLQEGSSVEITVRKNRMKVEAERAKKALSGTVSTLINLPFIAMKNGVPFSVNLELSRNEFELLIREMAMSTLAEVDKALQDAGLSISKIDEVLLVGGSTRIPYIQEIVQTKFNKVPRKDINPDEAVALGAAIQGAIKSGEISAKNGLLVTDVCPYTLGVEVVRVVGGQYLDGFFDPLIQRNSTIPIRQEKIYSTLNDNQESVNVKVFQGESNYIDQNISLGEVEVGDLPIGPAGQEVKISFQYNVNGTLDVEVTIVKTGKKVSKTLRGQAGVMSEEETKASLEKLNQTYEQSELYKEVKTVLYRAEKMLMEIDGENRRNLERLIQQLKHALTQNNQLEVKKLEEELTDFLIELV
jgi:molecular chaperone DnaK